MGRLRAVIALALLLSPASAWAWGALQMGAQVLTTAAGSCPSGTYMFAYDSNYSGDVRKACEDDATTTITGSDVGTISVDSTNGVTINAVDEGLLFSVTTAEISPATGTIWMSVYCEASRTTIVHLLEAYVNGNNRLGVYVPSNGRATFSYRGSGNEDSVTSPSGQGIADTEWRRLLITWDSSLGDGSEKLKVQFTGKTATENTAMTLDAPTSITSMILGEPSGISASTGTTNYCYVKNVYVLSGYNTADPAP